MRRVLVLALILAGCGGPWFEGRWSGAYTMEVFTISSKGTASVEVSDGGAEISMLDDRGGRMRASGPVDQAGYADLKFFLNADAGTTDWSMRGDFSQTQTGKLQGIFVVRSGPADAGAATFVLQR